MLEDYRKVMVDRRGEEEQFSSDHIVDCMKKGICQYCIFLLLLFYAPPSMLLKYFIC